MLPQSPRLLALEAGPAPLRSIAALNLPVPATSERPKQPDRHLYQPLEKKLRRQHLDPVLLQPVQAVGERKHRALMKDRAPCETYYIL